MPPEISLTFPTLPPGLDGDPLETFRVASVATHGGFASHHTPTQLSLPEDLTPDVTLGSSPCSADRLEFTPTEMGAIGVQGRRGFVLQCKLGEGGFGEVWRAVQCSLGRVVAVKRLRDNITPEDASVGSTQYVQWVGDSFRQEALTAAYLDHPNIVPVHDLGEDDGKPVLAMKLIEGASWHDMIRDDFFAMTVPDFLDKHLPILVAVGQAVAFAHARGIVHRDIKPAQVMVGKFGEVLLMDWGLAIAVHHDQHPDSPLHRHRRGPLHEPVNPAGTPSFMAPEQTDPTPDRLGTWTDVYLLGGALYVLLTGRFPHQASNSTLAFRMAMEGHVEAPHKAAPQREMPPALVQLAMKAMAPSPTERVASAEEFVRALRNYLSGADKRRESLELTARASHLRANARGDYSVLAECLNHVTRALMLWPDHVEAAVLRQRVLADYARAAIANRDLRLARVHAESMDACENARALLAEIAHLEDIQRQQDERVRAAYRQAEIDREAAERARARSEQMRARAEQLVNFLLGDLHAALKGIHRLDLLRRVTEQSLLYFNALGDDELGEADLAGRVRAYLTIGDVWNDEGRRDQAVRAYLRGLESAQVLAERAPQSAEAHRALADAHDRLGQLSYYRGRLEDAEAYHRQALEWRDGVMRLAGDANATVQKAESLHRLAVVLWRRQDFAASFAIHGAGRALLEPLLQADPANEAAAAALAANLSTLANVHRDGGDLASAIAVSRESLRIRRGLSERQPTHLPRLEEMLWTSGNLALLLMLNGDLAESLACIEGDLPVRRRLTADDPDNVVRRQAIAFLLGLQGEVLLLMGRLDEAHEATRDAMALGESLAARDRDGLWHVSARAYSCCRLAELALIRGDAGAATPWANEAVGLATAALEVQDRNTAHIKAMARSLGLVAHVATAHGDAKAAGYAVARARGVLGRLAAGHEEPQMLELRCRLMLLAAWAHPGEQAPAEVETLLARLAGLRWRTPYLERLRRDIEARRATAT